MSKRKRLRLSSYAQDMRISSREKRIFSGDARKHRVNQLMDILSDWKQTPFENEGAIHAGIRSSLCLQGYTWKISDAEAAFLINDAFIALGIQRPTWEQGQPEYTIARESCVWCGGHMPPEYLTEGKTFRFCSSVCARSALESRSFDNRAQYNKIYSSVYRLIKKEGMTKQTCLECGVKFNPSHTSKGLYCSTVCSAKSRRLEEKPCPNCGTVFHPANFKVECCSVKCASEYKFKKSTEACCEYCKKPFIKYNKTMRYCSVNCRRLMSNLVTGRRIPKHITPPVFDFYFAHAA